MKQRLLIVDDEPGIVDMMASYFSSQYEVLTAYCGNEALQKLARQPDLILLDINMPDIQIPLKAGWIAGAAIIQEHIGFPISKAAMR